jgi:hypothetical protein
MSDIDLAATGKDFTVQILVAGVPTKVLEMVKFKVTEVIEKTETKPLGTTRRNINTEPLGWELELEIDVSRKEADDLADIINSAATLRVPLVLIVATTTKFRDGSKGKHKYMDLKKTAFTMSDARGENKKCTIKLETGFPRVAL